MDKKDIRIGDTVEVKFKAKVTGKNGDFANLDVGRTVVALEYYLISNVIARVETKDETIDRLEKEKAVLEERVKELEQSNDGLAQGYLNDFRRAFPHMMDVKRSAQQEAYDNRARGAEIATGISKFEAGPWYPDQLEGYGPWIEGSGIPPETNLYGYRCYVRNGNEYFYCKKLEEEKPWYPEQLEGYGPWVKSKPGEVIRQPFLGHYAGGGLVAYCKKLED